MAMVGACLALACTLILPMHAMWAQALSAPMRTPPPDSLAWGPILTLVTERLALHITRAALDSSHQPWRMSFPASGAPWAQVERQLRAALRARSVTPADSVFHELHIGPLTVNADTARVEVRSGQTQLCADASRRGGYGNVEQVFAVRSRIASSHLWGVARSPEVLHGDQIGCGARRR